MRVLLSALASLSATPVIAADYDAAPNVEADARSDSAASISASMDVAAPPNAVWTALTDCARAPEFMPRLISCKVLKKDPAGRWEVREHVLKGNVLKPRMRNVFRAELSPPRRFSFHRIAGDWKRSEGLWTITPIDGGKGSHVTYHTEVAVNGPAPVSMVRQAVLKGMPRSMIALRKEATARAKSGL